MPGGGIGPRRIEDISALRSAPGGGRLPRGASALQIYYYLGLGRVYYQPLGRELNFVPTASEDLLKLLSLVIGGVPAAQTIPIDAHAMFKPLIRVVLPREHEAAVLVALRLAGYQVYSPADVPLPA